MESPRRVLAGHQCHQHSGSFACDATFVAGGEVIPWRTKSAGGALRPAYRSEASPARQSRDSGSWLAATGQGTQAELCQEKVVGTHLWLSAQEPPARMRYNEYLAKGYPIASGVIEGGVPAPGQRPHGTGRHALDPLGSASDARHQKRSPRRPVASVSAIPASKRATGVLIPPPSTGRRGNFLDVGSLADRRLRPEISDMGSFLLTIDNDLSEIAIICPPENNLFVNFWRCRQAE